jgi:mRNA interferase MazF
MTPSLRYQWGVFFAELDPVVGSEQHGRRPVLIVSQEMANQILPVVTGLPLTSRKPGRRVYPNEIALPAGTAGLQAESLVLCHQIRTLSKLRLATTCGTVAAPADQDAIRKALRFHLDL